MKIGDYVRTKDGIILKIKVVEDIYTNDNEYIGTAIYDNDGHFVNDVEIIKSAEGTPKGLLSLIEVGDYVNGLPVRSVEGTRFDENDLRVWLAVATKYVKEYGVENSAGDYEFDTLYRCIKPENIKSIVTKEQFESMEYKIESEAK